MSSKLSRHWNFISIDRILSKLFRSALLPCTLHLTPARESEQKEHTEIGLFSVAKCSYQETNDEVSLQVVYIRFNLIGSTYRNKF